MCDQTEGSYRSSDAQSYGACAYMRSVDSSGEVGVVLLTAKLKVAPLKCQSIQRFELYGALMVARLSKRVLEAIKMDVVPGEWFSFLGWTSGDFGGSFLGIGPSNRSSCSLGLLVYTKHLINKIMTLYCTLNSH